MQGARIAETPDTKPASCWICHPPSQCHGRAFRGEGSVICTASPSSQHANPRLGTVHPQFHERPHGRPVHHFMTKFERGTVMRVLRQTSRAARHSQHDEEMRGPAATRGEKVSTSLTWRKSGFSHITSRLGLAWISEAGLISGAPRNSSLGLSRCRNLPLSPRTDLTADLMASLWHTFFWCASMLDFRAGTLREAASCSCRASWTERTSRLAGLTAATSGLQAREATNF